MVSRWKHNLSFMLLLTSKLITCFIGSFTWQWNPNQLLIYSMEVNIYILDFGPWRWSALNYVGFVVKWPSRMQWAMSFSQVGRAGKNFRSGPENSHFLDGWLPLPDSNSPKKFVRASLPSSMTYRFKGSLAWV